ncbi:MAG: NADH-quinone oxidoreductase subunit L [Peptococcaceae bacterium]|nr:NADH-quinone oxidoreductase subunit L [Peptococcaceae bacterium]
MVQFSMHNAWLVPLLPALSFIIIAFITKQWKKTSAILSVGSMAISCFIASLAAYGVFSNYTLTEEPMVYSVKWFSMAGLNIDVGVQLDPVSAMMMFMVTLVSTLIFIYSIGYMEGDQGYSVFFSYLSLFGASMLLLIISSNLLQMFVAWELVGLCSYLLIGFYSHKVTAREAAKKAFITCRVADFGLLLGLISLQLIFGTLDIVELSGKISNFEQYTSMGIMTIIAILIFIGPIGKSGQFPLHVWLPDAMEGPTPVSALIHAATMVVAGVYLIARTIFLFAEVPPVMDMVAAIGGFTALFAASIAITQRDMKRILAYSTISQIGYMMLALGLGSLTASMFHLWTHAFFKALMFLGAGSVLYALHHKGDIWKMGGLLRKMPVTGYTFMVGCLAISGVPPFSGFWSKDEILLTAFDSGHYILFTMAALTSFMTAFYMWRLFFLAFTGQAQHEVQVKESPRTMTLPLVVLAFFAAIAGLIGTPWAPIWQNWIFSVHPHHPQANTMIMLGSVVLALAGMYLAYNLYYLDRSKAERMAEKYSFFWALSYNKFYVDELYLWFTHTIVDGGARLFYLFDIYIVDGIIVNGIGSLTKSFGSRLRLVQTGSLQSYALVFFLGVLAVAVIMALTDPSMALGLMGGVE